MANHIDLAKYVAKVEVDDSGLKSGLSESDSLIKGTLDKMGLATKLSIAGMVAAVGVGIKKSIDSFTEFENQMNSVYTLLPDITESAMKDMEDQVRSLSKEMGVLPNELIPALYSSLSASVPEDNVFEFLEVAQKGAIAGMTETETVVDGLTTVLNSYHMEATEAEKVSDILFNTIKFGKTSMEELSGSMSQVTPIASSLGVNFEDIGAALATMTAQGNSTSASTTQLKQLFSELSKEGTKTSDVFKQIAGKSFKEFIAEGHNVNDALQLMEGYANETGVGINDLFSSVQAGQAALMLTGESAEMFANNIDNMANSAGATQQAYETMDASISRSFEKMKVAMADMFLELGTNLAPAVSSSIEYITEAMPTIQNIIEITFQAMGDVIKVFVGIIDWLIDNLKQFYNDNEEIFNGIFETFSSIFNSIIEIVKWFIELFKLLWTKYGEYITEYTDAMWEIISSIFRNTLEIIKGVLDFFIGLFTGDWNRMGEGFKTITSSFWNMIKDIFNASLEAIKAILTLAITAFTDLAVAIMTGLWDGFKTIWEFVTEWFENVFGALLEWLNGLLEDFFDIGKGMFGWMWDGMKDIWTGMKKWVEDKVDWLKSQLRFWEKTKSKMGKSSGGGGTFVAPSPGGSSAKAASYDIGTNFVPMDGFAYLHKGEQVIPASMQGKPYRPEPNNEITENHYHISTVEIRDVKDFDDFIRGFTNVVDNYPNKAIMKVKKIGQI